MRKTIEVIEVLRMANHMLANSDDSQVAERMATANFLESILHATGAYAGYSHLPSAQINHDAWNEAWNVHRAVVEIREANGLSHSLETLPRWTDYCKDDSRRVYYKKPELLRKDS